MSSRSESLETGYRHEIYQNITPSNNNNNKSILKDLYDGDAIIAGNIVGVIRYLGPLYIDDNNITSDEYIGIECVTQNDTLNNQKLHNGLYNNFRYFTTKNNENNGILIHSNNFTSKISPLKLLKIIKTQYIYINKLKSELKQSKKDTQLLKLNLEALLGTLQVIKQNNGNNITNNSRNNSISPNNNNNINHSNNSNENDVSYRSMLPDPIISKGGAFQKSMSVKSNLTDVTTPIPSTVPDGLLIPNERPNYHGYFRSPTGDNAKQSSDIGIDTDVNINEDGIKTFRPKLEFKSRSSTKKISRRKQSLTPINDSKPDSPYISRNNTVSSNISQYSNIEPKLILNTSNNSNNINNNSNNNYVIESGTPNNNIKYSPRILPQIKPKMARNHTTQSSMSYVDSDESYSDGDDDVNKGYYGMEQYGSFLDSE